MVPEISSMTDRIFCHLGLYFALYPPPSCPPPNNPENQNFEKIKKTPGDIILQMSIYHKWKSYDIWSLRYGARQTEPFFALSSIPKIMIICYTVSEIWCVTHVILIFHFGLFFCPFTPPPPPLFPLPNSPKNQNFKI